MNETVLGVLLSALLALSAWTVKTVLEVKTVLMGESGNNGLRKEVRDCVESIADAKEARMKDQLEWTQWRGEIDNRVEQIERRHGPADRRHGASS